MPDMFERIQIRSRFWLRYLRWAVTLQIAWALIVGYHLAEQGVRGRWSLPDEVQSGWGLALPVMALGIAVRRRNLGRAEITPPGIRPYTFRHGWGSCHRWGEILSVRLKAGLFGSRWLEVVPEDAPPFKLTAHPTHPDSVFDALERFAGPDHPLTRAYATFHS